MAGQIQILRDFRDQYLLTNPVGQAIVDFYYRYSPPVAEFITEHPALRPVVRAWLLPIVATSAMAMNATPAERTALIGFPALLSTVLVVWAVRRRNRGLHYG
jgi:hypothetical protein